MANSNNVSIDCVGGSNLTPTPPSTLSRPPPFTPSHPPPSPGTRPGGLPEAEQQQARQRQEQQQRLRALEQERKLALLQNRPVRPEYLSDEAWAENLDRSSAAWREEHARVVEWWSSPSPAAGQDGGEDSNGADDNNVELLGVLTGVRRAYGYCAVAMGHSSWSSDVGKAVAIEWANIKARSDFYASSEASTSFTQAMQHANLERFFAYQQLDRNGSIIHADALPSSLRDVQAHATQIYEIWSAYFPTDLPTSTIETIEKQEGPFQLPRTYGGKRHPNEEIMYGAWRRSHGWAVDDGPIEYRNRPARRMIYVFLWENEESRRVYREEAIWRKTTRDGRVLDSPTDGFSYELEELGMLGLVKRDFRLVGLGDVGLKVLFDKGVLAN